MQSAQSGAKVIPHEVAVPTNSLDAMDTIATLPPSIEAPQDMRTASKSDPQYPAKARQ
jgi:hypothetical protein